MRPVQPHQVLLQAQGLACIEQVVPDGAFKAGDTLGQQVGYFLREFIGIVRVQTEAGRPLAKFPFTLHGRQNRGPLFLKALDIRVLKTCKPLQDFPDQFRQTVFGLCRVHLYLA